MTIQNRKQQTIMAGPSQAIMLEGWIASRNPPPFCTFFPEGFHLGASALTWPTDRPPATRREFSHRSILEDAARPRQPKRDEDRGDRVSRSTCTRRKPTGLIQSESLAQRLLRPGQRR